jgi:hypothetical protein
MPNRPAYYIQQSLESAESAIILPFQPGTSVDESQSRNVRRQLVSTKELSEIWRVPESTFAVLALRRTRPPVREIGWKDQV